MIDKILFNLTMCEMSLLLKTNKIKQKTQQNKNKNRTKIPPTPPTQAFKPHKFSA